MYASASYGGGNAWMKIMGIQELSTNLREDSQCLEKDAFKCPFVIILIVKVLVGAFSKRKAFPGHCENFATVG